MRLLFDIGLPSHIRHYDNVIDELRSRGHTVVVSTSMEDASLFKNVTIPTDHRNVISNVLFTVDEPWGELSYLLRCARDVLHYRRHDFDQSRLLRTRIENMLGAGLAGPSAALAGTLRDFIDRLEPERHHDLSTLLRAIDESLPASPKVLAALRKHRPDVMLVTPLIVTQYNQADILKAARTLGVPVGYMVFSWDNLTTKGVVHLEPDATFVWNSIQEGELRRFHGIAQNVYQCGAPRFDYFFAKQPSLSRERFCHKYGLDAHKPIVTYLCSSNLVSSAETEFVTRWIAALNAAPDDVLRNCNVLIRPHPKFRGIWDGFSAGSTNRRVAIVGSSGLNNDQLLFDTLHASAVVVGLNTSAQLEAAVLRKPVLTIDVPEYNDGQTGTLHFHYLLREHGGFVERSESLELHVEKLSAVLTEGYDLDAITRFVGMFIRPKGMDRPAATVTAEAIEAFARTVQKPKISYAEPRPTRLSARSMLATMKRTLKRALLLK